MYKYGLDEVMEKVRNSGEYDIHKALAKSVGRDGEAYGALYDLIKNEVTKGKLTWKEAYVLYIYDVRNTMQCLNNVANLIERKIKGNEDEI